MNHASNARAQRAWRADPKLQMLKEGRSPATTLRAVCEQSAIKLPQFDQWARGADRGARAA